MSNIERAAEVIADELPEPVAEHEFSVDYRNGLVIVRDVAGRAAEALADEGLLMPDLPAPDVDEIFVGYPAPHWSIDKEHGGRYMVGHRRGRVTTPGGDHSPTEARAIAHALLAAAEEADRA